MADNGEMVLSGNKAASEAASSETRLPGPVQRSWAAVLASLIFSVAAYEMFDLYALVHWRIMFRTSPEIPEPPFAVFTVLGRLAWLRFDFAVLALVWAVWSFRTGPRWASIVALAVSFLALGLTVIMM